jgi:hypothetical protein
MAYVGMGVIVGSSVGVAVDVSEGAVGSVSVAVSTGVRVAVAARVGREVWVNGTSVSREAGVEVGLGDKLQAESINPRDKAKRNMRFPFIFNLTGK